MDIQNLIEINNAKKSLLKNREAKINKKIVQLNKDKLATNRPERQKIPVHVRSKIIQKKSFKTVQEKVKSKQIELQDNITASTFVYRSEKFLRIVDKTRKALNLDQGKIRQCCQMLIGFAKDRFKEKNLYLRVTFSQELNCMLRPIQIQLPHHDPAANGKCILITEFGKTKEQDFDELRHLNIEVVSLAEFRKRLHNHEFKKSALKPTTKLFCDFKIYSHIENTPLFRDILSRTVIFPIENGKVPFGLRDKFGSYAEYVEDLCRHSYFITRSQQEHLVRVCRLRGLTIGELSENADSGALQIVSRLFEKNKLKNVRVQSIELRTDTSINLPIYSAE